MYITNAEGDGSELQHLRFGKGFAGFWTLKCLTPVPTSAVTSFLSKVHRKLNICTRYNTGYRSRRQLPSSTEFASPSSCVALGVEQLQY